MKFRTLAVTVSAGVLTGLMGTSFAHAQTAHNASKSVSSLYVVESCKPFAKGARCSLSLEHLPAAAQAPSGTQTQCAPGWVAHLQAEQGTVESGGINRGASVVCGYTSAEAALRAAFQACNQQTFVQCNLANQINVVWAQWDPSVMPAATTGQTVTVQQIPGSMSCVSGIPLKESAQCSAAAVAQLRAVGLR